MIRDMAGMTLTMVPAPDSSRTGDTLIVKGQPSGCPFLYAFVRHRPGGLGGKRLCRKLPSRIFACGRAFTGLESSVKGHRKKFFEIFPKAAEKCDGAKLPEMCRLKNFVTLMIEMVVRISILIHNVLLT